MSTTTGPAAATPAGTRAAVLALATALGLLGAGYLMYADLRRAADGLAQRVREVDERLAAQERTLQLYRFEQQSKAGLGFPALLEQIRFWAPQAAVATTPEVKLPVIEKQLRDVCAAVVALGPEAFVLLEEAFRQSQPGTDYEVRRWLLTAMIEVDKARAKEFLASVAQGLGVPVSPRLRLFASDRLLELDPALAAQVLEQILSVETHRGLDPERVAPAVLAEHPDAVENLVPYRGFSGFIQRYVATGHANEQILVRILTRWRDHDLMTLQEAVKALAALHSADAVEPIKELFETPPRGFTPMFRNYCLDALADIMGADACSYLKEALRREQNETVITKLTDLIKKSCP
jgi:hypothetical protein